MRASRLFYAVLCFCLVIAAATPSASARPGDLRSAPASVVERPGDVLAASVSADGSVTIAGLFSRVDGKSVPGLAKLTGDGRVDESFVPGVGIAPRLRTSPNGGAASVIVPCPVFQVLDPGRQLLGDPGIGLAPGGQQWFVMGRQGQIMADVLPVIPLDDPVMPQFVADGKLVAIVSSPDPATGLVESRVRRLRLDTGADDPGFSPGDEGGVPSQVRPAPNGGLWLLENESSSGAFRLRLLEENGAESASFAPQSIAGSAALLQSMPADALAVSSSQTVLDFRAQTITWTHRLQFLGADGSPVRTREQEGGSPPFFIEPDGALLLEEGVVSGPVGFLPAPRPRTLWRELPGGTRDDQFQSVHTTRLVHRLTDGRLLADGTKLHLPNGAPDNSWHVPAVRQSATVRALFAIPGGAVIGAGDFTEVDGQRRPGIARWRADGLLDTVFAPADDEGEVRDCAVAADGSVAVLRRDDSGARMQRLRPDGTVDVSFVLTKPDSASFPFDSWEEIEPLPDGAILALVRWTSRSQWGLNLLAQTVVRVSSQGQCMEIGDFANRMTNGSGLLALPDGRFFHAGRRWMANATADPTFTPPGGIGSIPLCAAGGGGSWLFLRGSDTLIGNLPPVLVRDDGSLDESWRPDITRPLAAAGGAGRSVIVAQSGEIIRLLADGRRDPSFHAPSLERRNESIPDGLPLLSAVQNGGPVAAHSMLVHPETGDLWVAGDFTRAGGEVRSAVARFDASVPSGFPDWSDAIFRGGPNDSTEADPDGDGAANWHEYAAGSDPLRADAGAFSGQILTSHPLCISAPLNPAATEVFQSLETSADLHTWRSATGAEAVRKIVSGRHAFELAPAAGLRFVRIRYRTLP